jgi:hypothetical protein
MDLNYRAAYNLAQLAHVRNILMISEKHQHLVFAFFMALFMSCIMSLVITTFNIGFTDNLLTIWLQAWSFAFVVAFPTVITIAPLVKKITAAVIKK